ncbi:MAG: hypothetical protein ACPGPF_09835, partial [Pontibacterium sp.]
SVNVYQATIASMAPLMALDDVHRQHYGGLMIELGMSQGKLNDAVAAKISYLEAVKTLEQYLNAHENKEALTWLREARVRLASVQLDQTHYSQLKENLDAFMLLDDQLTRLNADKESNDFYSVIAYDLLAEAYFELNETQRAIELKKEGIKRLMGLMEEDADNPEYVNRLKKMKKRLQQLKLPRTPVNVSGSALA